MPNKKADTLLTIIRFIRGFNNTLRTLAIMFLAVLKKLPFNEIDQQAKCLKSLIYSGKYKKKERIRHPSTNQNITQARTYRTLFLKMIF
jgi:hypothetical protein